MTKTPMCEDKSVLAAYLYGECSAEERRSVEAHLANCSACRDEVDGLRDLRGHLAQWAPPEQLLGFRVVSADAPPGLARRSWWRAPAWGLAAAAVLVLAVAAAIARVEVRYDAQGFVVRTGWSASQPAAPALVAARPAAPVEATPWRADLRALEAVLRRDLAPTPAAATPAAPAGAALLKQVNALIEASETRQRRDLALRLAMLVQDVEQRRRADWVRIQAGFGRLEDLTGAGVAQQREMLNYMMRVSGRER